jgi:hypothetical protein
VSAATSSIQQVVPFLLGQPTPGAEVLDETQSMLAAVDGDRALGTDAFGLLLAAQAVNSTPMDPAPKRFRPGWQVIAFVPEVT